MRRLPASFLWVVLMALVTLAGCASRAYLYRPEEHATARLAGRPAAFYDVPLEAPRGSVRIAALGIATLESTAEDHGSIRAMHVRMVVDNNDGAAPWQVDTRAQLGVIGNGYGESRPAFATSSVGRPPVVSIAPRGTVTFDLYYPLPEDMQSASKIPEFQVLWTVQTAQGLVAERTSFERLTLEPAPLPPAYGLAYAGAWWGPGWWYDPFWPDDTFGGAVVLSPGYYPAPVAVGQVAPPAVRVR